MISTETSTEERMLSESRIEGCLQSLRSTDPCSDHQRYKWKKVVQRELFFLRQSYPDSYILQVDMSDVNLD